MFMRESGAERFTGAEVAKPSHYMSYVNHLLISFRKNTSHSKDNQMTTITATDAVNVDLQIDIFLQIIYSKA